MKINKKQENNLLYTKEVVARIMKALDARLLNKACSKATAPESAEPAQKRLIEIAIDQ
jgi:hypothetical protein